MVRKYKGGVWYEVLDEGPQEAERPAEPAPETWRVEYNGSDGFEDIAIWYVLGAEGQYVAESTVEANARRIARLPDLERENTALLEATEAYRAATVAANAVWAGDGHADAPDWQARMEEAQLAVQKAEDAMFAALDAQEAAPCRC